MEDLLAISLNEQSIILGVTEKIRLKNDSIEPPEVYFGVNIAKKSLSGQEIWTMPSVDYVKVIINNIEVRLKKYGMN